MPCSRTQHGLTRVGLEPPTSGSAVRGINHQATALPFTTIEPQSAESMDTNDGDVQSFPDQILRVNKSTTRTETGSSESMNAKQSAVRCYNARILQLNDKPGSS